MEGESGRRGKAGGAESQGRVDFPDRSRRRRVALFTVIWLVVVTSRCSLKINPLKASQAPGPFNPSWGASRDPGRKVVQESLCHSSGSLLLYLGSDAVAATSLIQTWQPLPPTCRDTSAESPAEYWLPHRFFTSGTPPPALFRASELGIQVGCSQPPLTGPIKSPKPS